MEVDYRKQLEQQARKWFGRKTRDKYYAVEGEYYEPYIGAKVQYLKLGDVDIVFIKSLLVEIFNNEFAKQSTLKSYNEVFKVIDLCEFKGKNSILDMLVFEPLDKFGFVPCSLDLDTVYYFCEMSYIAFDKNKRSVSDHEQFDMPLTSEEYISLIECGLTGSICMNKLLDSDPLLAQKIARELLEYCNEQPCLIFFDDIEMEINELMDSLERSN